MSPLAGHECESAHDPERKNTGKRDGAWADGWKRKTTHDERVRSSWKARVITALALEMKFRSASAFHH